MAKKIVVVDDISGEELEVTTCRFSLNGAAWEIDLSPENVTELERVLAPFIQAGRQYRKPRSAGSSSVVAIDRKAKRAAGKKPATIDKEQANAIREWAMKNSIRVSTRGRIAKEVVDAWQVAHA